MSLSGRMSFGGGSRVESLVESQVPKAGRGAPGEVDGAHGRL